MKNCRATRNLRNGPRFRCHNRSATSHCFKRWPTESFVDRRKQKRVGGVVGDYKVAQRKLPEVNHTVLQTEVTNQLLLRTRKVLAYFDEPYGESHVCIQDMQDA